MWGGVVGAVGVAGVVRGVRVVRTRVVHAVRLVVASINFVSQVVTRGDALTEVLANHGVRRVPRPRDRLEPFK